MQFCSENISILATQGALIRLLLRNKTSCNLGHVYHRRGPPKTFYHMPVQS